MRLELADADATEALGRQLAAGMQRGVVYLEGDLGAGKTALARAILHGRGYPGKVKSPTYTLVEPYELQAYQVQVVYLVLQVNQVQLVLQVVLVAQVQPVGMVFPKLVVKPELVVQLVVPVLQVNQELVQPQVQLVLQDQQVQQVVQVKV